MTDKQDTGGPAFPDWPESAFPSTFQSISPEPHQVHRWGMTLRDYFAAKALHYALRNCFTTEGAAENAYEIADAMLKAREQ